MSVEECRPAVMAGRGEKGRERSRQEGLSCVIAVRESGAASVDDDPKGPLTASETAENRVVMGGKSGLQQAGVL